MEEQDWGREEGYLGTEATEVINFCRICYPHHTRRSRREMCKLQNVGYTGVVNFVRVHLGWN